MSITIKLDAPALRALIENDEVFKLELQRSVVAEVVRNFLMKDAPAVVKAVAPEAIGKIIASMKDDAAIDAFVERTLAQLYTPRNWGTPAKIKPELQELVDKRVAEVVNRMIGDMGAKVSVVTDAVNERLDAYLASDAIPGHIRQNVTLEVAKRIQAGVNERLDALKAALEVG